MCVPLVLLGLGAHCATEKFAAQARPIQPNASYRARPTPSEEQVFQAVPAAPIAGLAAGPIDLTVTGHRPAVLFVPNRTQGRRPVVVAAHGAGDTAEALCDFWHSLLLERAFILCPRGTSMGRDNAMSRDARSFYRTHFALRDEVAAAIDALSAQYGPEMDASAFAYTGYSQGATMGALALPLLTQSFASAILVEGGFDNWDLRNAQKLAKRGTARVLFVCGRPICANAARASAKILESAGVQVRVVHAVAGGHTYGGAVGRGLADSLEWALSPFDEGH